MTTSSIVAVVLISIFLATVCALGFAIYSKQKELDAPFRGILIVDKQEDGPAMVYMQAVVDPGTFKEGEAVKLRVRIVKPDSQGKHGS